MTPSLILRSLSIGLLLAGSIHAQPLTPSGDSGIDLVYATAPTGESRLFAVSLTLVGAPAATPIGQSLPAPPSRWLHRRRTLGALETSITWIEDGLAITPLGSAIGDGALHLVDTRNGFIDDRVIATGNPASYDLAVAVGLRHIYVAEDDGAGGTMLRGFSYAQSGLLAPLDPPHVTLPGSPAAHVTELFVEPGEARLHVPTTNGISVIALSATTPQMAIAATLGTGTQVPMTNVASFDRNGTPSFVIGTSSFDASDLPDQAGFLSWEADGSAFETGTWSTIPGLFPARNYVPAAGTTELAVVGDGTDTWAYFLLRDPSPTASFIRPSAVGVVRFIGSDAAVVADIPYPTEGGEPFAIPTVHGTRIAIESSQGPPFSFTPPDGGEPISILYTPLDPLGAGTADGVLATPSPLGGRISTKGMDRPIWTRDGTRVVCATSHFPGAPNPGSPGIEVLNVPATLAVNFHTPPHYVVPNFESPHRSVIFPSSYTPREPATAPFLDGFSFIGNVFHNGMASIMVLPFGEVGQFQTRDPAFVQSPNIPNFPAVYGPAFLDATGSTRPVPLSFGSRRTSWNLYSDFGMAGLVMSAATGDKILIQPSGFNFLAITGVLPTNEAQPVEVALPSGWITSSEILSL